MCEWDSNKVITSSTEYVSIRSILPFSKTIPNIELKKDPRFAIEEDLPIHIDNKRRSHGIAYDSGYDHGCDDAGISNLGDRYINQPEKGPSFHTVHLCVI